MIVGTASPGDEAAELATVRAHDRELARFECLVGSLSQ
jgi:hypothetical protein